LKAYRRRRGTAPEIHNLGAGRWWVFNATPGPHYSWERTLGLIASLDGFVEEKIS